MEPRPLLVHTFLLQHIVSLNLSVHDFLLAAKDEPFPGSSWAKECVTGLAGLAPFQGEGNWDLMPGALVRDWCITKPLPAKGLVLLVL